MAEQRAAEQDRSLAIFAAIRRAKQPELLDGDVCNWALVQIFSMSS